VFAGGVQLHRMGLLPAGEFELLPRSLPFDMAIAMPSRVRSRSRSTSNSANVAKMLKNILPIGSDGSYSVRSSASATPRAARQSPISRASGEPVELGDDEGVAGPDRGQGLVQAGAVAVGAGEAVVEVDPLGVDAELEQGLMLGGEVLLVGGAAGVTDPDRGHEPRAYG
jgi:hypothetical protein